MRDLDAGEVMHPVVGPSVEATRLYCDPSMLSKRLRDSEMAPLVLFDVGLGAGSNALAAWRLSEALGSRAHPLEIVSFERRLDALELALHPENAADFGFTGDAYTAADALLREGEHRASHTSWRLVEGALPGSLAGEPDARADVVFWDPFSPRANPELWTMAAFAALRRCCSERATVHTYSGATATRSALLLAGFAVGVGPSTGANKFSTCAAARAEQLASPLDLRWLERLGRSSAPWPSDAPADALARVAAMPQFALRP